MKETKNTTRKKLIDIPEDVFHYLSIKAAIDGTNLKKYIENIIIEDVKNMDDDIVISSLAKAKPSGKAKVGRKKKGDSE